MEVQIRRGGSIVLKFLNDSLCLSLSLSRSLAAERPEYLVASLVRIMEYRSGHEKFSRLHETSIDIYHSLASLRGVILYTGNCISRN